MFKRNNKKLRMLLTLALALVLCLGSMTTAFAAEGEAIEGTPEAPADAAITKVLNLPEGTTIPSGMNFVFDVTKVSVDGATAQADLDTMPTIGTSGKVTISFAEADKSGALTTTANGVITIPKESDPTLFPGGGSEFPHAGIYRYHVEENTTDSYTAGAGETLTFSEAEYDLIVQVENSETGLYIHYIATVVTVIDIPGGPAANDKVDPTPGGQEDEYDYSQMIFTNNYTKTTGGPGPDSPSVYIANEITGGLGNQETLYFSYAVTITAPATLPSGAYTYRAYIVEDGAVLTTIPAANGTKDGNDSTNDYFTFTSGTLKNISLKHDQRLAFTAVHVGARYVAVQDGETNYTPEVEIKENGGTAETINGTEGASLSTATALKPLRLVGDTLPNYAEFTNDYDSEPPTGIDLNDLPYYGLILLALGALIVFIVARSRKRAQNDN
jgi:hypothetical protein